MSELFAAFGINWKLLVVQTVNFGLLLVILWRFLYQPILRMIDERHTTITEGVKNAEEAARKLALADGEGKAVIARAGREAEGLVSDARTRAEEKRVQLMKVAEERAADILRDAEARAEEAKRQALATSEREIAKTAMLAAEKILREKSA